MPPDYTAGSDPRDWRPLPGISQRQPPASPRAEMALLGALLANNRAFERVAEFLLPEHFADPAHGLIYAAIQRRVDAGQLADALTLQAEFEHSGALDEVGGVGYFATLLGAMVGIINAGEYGRAIRDAWIRRQLIDIGELIVNTAFGSEGGADGVAADGPGQIEAAETRLFALAAKGATDRGPIPFDAALDAAIATAAQAYGAGGGVSGLTTGLIDLDRQIGGLHASDLVILAGRPGMGKTALATKIAYGAARALARLAAEAQAPRAAGTVAVFSLEMSAEQLAQRVIAEEARVSADRIRRGAFGQRDMDRFVGIRRDLAGLPLHVDDTAALSLSALRTRCRRLQRQRGLSLVVVDYLQLMRPSLGAKAETRVLEISQITAGLKAIAKEMAVPVLALSQLSRAVESREDKRPQLSDLRESGTIEQDADMVLFVYRDEYYLKQREPKPAAYSSEEKYQAALDKWQRDMEAAYNRAEILIEKQRHGPTGTVPLLFEGEFTRFADLVRDGAP